MSSPLGVWGDPCVVFDLNGHCYFAHLSNPSSGGYWIDRIVVQKSINKGQTWSSGVGIGYNPPTRNQDKEWLAVDWTNSPFRNNIYMARTEFDSYGSSNQKDSTRILFSRSTDGGTTWSAPVRVSDKGGDCIDEDNTVEGAVPAVGPNGEVYLAWAGPLGLAFDKSTDSGVTWGIDEIINSIPGGWDFNVPGIYRCNGLPITACDISNSPYRGTIYVNWSDQRNGINNTDIFLIKSTDGGNTWSQPKKVNQDNTQTHQFFTWMTVDPATGYLYFVYYDRRNYSDNRTDVYLARSTDGGETFTEIKVSQSPFTPTSSIFFGDYTGIAALNGKVYPIWTRLENNQRSIWMAIFYDTLPSYPTANLSINEGWNLLSVPLKKNNMFYKDIFHNSTSYAYTYENGYLRIDSLKLGNGFWLKFPQQQIVNIVGQSLNEISIPIKAGWNLIGGLNGIIPVSSVQTNPPNILSSPFYEYNSGYQISEQIVKGKGYWVKSNSEGNLILSISGLFKGNISVIDDRKQMGSIEISDLKSSTKIFLAEKVFDKDKFELPPQPPANIFDVRFEDETNVIFVGEEKLLKVQSENDLIYLEFSEPKSDKILMIRFLDGKEYKLRNGQILNLKLDQSKSFYLKFTSNHELKNQEKLFYVSEIFPNPFNSTTKIRYYIPETSENIFYSTEIRVYDLIGRLITIHNVIEKSGYHEFIFDGGKYNLSSGLYICEIVIRNLFDNSIHRQLKKMNYIK